MDNANTIAGNKAHLWQIAFFSLNNTSTNLYLAMMGYVSYYANGIAGLSVVLVSFILTGMRVFDGIDNLYFSLPLRDFFKLHLDVLQFLSYMH